jgi:hypothetical protein
MQIKTSLQPPRAQLEIQPTGQHIQTLPPTATCHTAQVAMPQTTVKPVMASQPSFTGQAPPINYIICSILF